MLPGDIALDLHTVQKLIEHQRLQVWIVLQNQREVAEGVLYIAELIQLQRLLPVVILEFHRCLFHAILCEHRFDLIVLQRQVAHGFIGRHLANGSIQTDILVQLTELVQPDDIKGVQQLTAHGIGSVVAVGELPVVDHNTCAAVGGNIVEAPVHGRGCVDVRKEGLNGFLNGVSAAKCANDAWLGQRIGLLGDATAYRFRLPAGHRPGGCVAPISVAGKVHIWVQLGAILGLEKELTVGGGGGPVHQATGLIGRIVKQVNADLFGDHAGHSRILLLGDFTGERDNHTESGVIRGMLMGGINTALEVVEQNDLVPDAGLAIVHIQSQHGSAQDHTVLATAFLKLTTNKAAYILDGVLGTFL